MALKVNRKHNFPKNDETPVLREPIDIRSTFREINEAVRICHN